MGLLGQWEIMKKFFFCLLLVFSGALSAASVRLHNDSPFKLRVVIHGADGSYLGEMIILPQHFTTWSSDYATFGPGGRGELMNPPGSLTPYTVTWRCMDGGEFGINVNVSVGALVTAQSSEGVRYCKPPKKKKKGESPYGPKPDDEQLQDESDNDQGSTTGLQDS